MDNQSKGNKMSRKDYVEMASIIRVNMMFANESEVALLKRVAKDMCIVFKKNNSRFDSNRFLVACGLDSE